MCDAYKKNVRQNKWLFSVLHSPHSPQPNHKSCIRPKPAHWRQLGLLLIKPLWLWQEFCTKWKNWRKLLEIFLSCFYEMANKTESSEYSYRITIISLMFAKQQRKDGSGLYRAEEKVTRVDIVNLVTRRRISFFLIYFFFSKVFAKMKQTPVALSLKWEVILGVAFGEF